MAWYSVSIVTIERVSQAIPFLPLLRDMDLGHYQFAVRSSSLEQAIQNVISSEYQNKQVLSAIGYDITELTNSGNADMRSIVRSGFGTLEE